MTRKPQKLPQVLSVEEVERLHAGSRNSKHRAALAVAYGATWRDARSGHLSLGQLKVMSAIERCRSAALGGHMQFFGTLQHLADCKDFTNYCRDRKISNKYSSNPHSSVATTLRHRLRPRGFLP